MPAKDLGTHLNIGDLVTTGTLRNFKERNHMVVLAI